VRRLTGHSPCADQESPKGDDEKEQDAVRDMEALTESNRCHAPPDAVDVDADGGGAAVQAPSRLANSKVF